MSRLSKSKVLAIFLVSLLMVSMAVGCRSLSKVETKPSEVKTEEKVGRTAFPLKLMDDARREVEVKEKPERIVSLAPSNTEISFALGLGDKIVGVTDFCDYPEEAKSKEKIGGFSDPNVEKIVELKPDLVLATGMHQKILGDLEKVNLKVFVLDPKSIGDVLGNIEVIGKLTGEEEAAESLVTKMRKKIDDVKKKVAGLSDEKKPLVYYEVWNDPIMTAGPGTFVYDIITIAGGKNIAADAAERYPKYSLEELVNRDPEVIIATEGSMGSPGKIKERKGWEGISAVKSGRVYVIGDENLVFRAGPRIVDGLVEVAKFIHPELFD